MLKLKQLKPDYADVLCDFKINFSDRGCTCFLSPPCGYCTHEGNPANLDETPEAWEYIQHRPISSRRAKYLKKRGKSVYYHDKLFSFFYEKPLKEAIE